MFQTWIVTNCDNLTNPISRALRENAECRVLTMLEASCQPYTNDLLQPDVLILDMESVEQPPGYIFEQLGCLNPDANVIVILPTGNSLMSEEFLPYGIDEIIIRPVDEEQTRRMIERLLERISAFDRLFTLQEKLRQEMSRSPIVVKSKPMREIMRKLPQLAACNSTVLITGETGTGKELIAPAIHYLGPSSGQPFVTVDSGTIPNNLVENELFGHVRGAYTDAGPPAKGLIQEADGGTLFLDEVESLPLAIQSKFLRFLQERQYKPLGQSKYIPVNVRVLAATNIDLAKAVAKKLFREDLYYRVNVVPLFIPPLRERKADIPALAHFFLQRHTPDQRTPSPIPHEVLRSWMDHDWPGNVRELENKVQAWLTGECQENWQEPAPFPTTASKAICTLAEARKEALTQCDRAYFQNLLTHTKGNISAAARLAGIHRKSLGALLKKYGIEAFRFHS